jgi:bifunctional non-homologous end joining protein LigD
MGLEVYHRKRNFGTTPEPRGRVHSRRKGGLAFVIQKHRASHLHYDFRLELDGVLLSWAVPKGPSLDPADKRLAMHVEDHPIEYGDFEGVIPPGQYGSGTVLLWDRGTWVPREDPVAGYRKGRLKFDLEGEKLHGGFTLVKSRSGKYGSDNSWLLIKENDAYAQPAAEGRVVDERPLSVLSGRSLDEIAADPEREWHSTKSVAENVAAGKVKRRAPSLALARVEGARKAPDPEWVAPVLATLVAEAPGGDEWLHEIKYDGYRMLCHVVRGRCTILSRNGRDWTDALPLLAAAAARLPVTEAWLDGEVIAADAEGRSSFQALQNAFAGEGAERLVYYAFDLPYANGYDLRDAPLAARKSVLRKLVPQGAGMVRYSDHVQGDGGAFFAEACRLGIEGIVSKRGDSPYRAGRGRDWVKVKCVQRQEMVIGGWTDPQGSRTGFGALLIGYHDADGKLRYAGKVGTGFNDKSLATVLAALRPLAVDRPPFFDPPTGAEGRRAHWVKPSLVAEVAFTEWTRDGTLRHPSFQGLRRDKDARQVVREVPQATQAGPGESDGARGQDGGAAQPAHDAAPKAAKRATATSRRTPATPKRATTAKRAPAAARRATAPKRAGANDEVVVEGVPLTHPGKLLYPEAGVSKRELAEYYAAVGERMLPHVAGRPLTLVRCPNGWGAHCFYQKHAKPPLPPFLDTIEVRESAGMATYFMADSVPALVSLLQMGVLEVHPWGSREGSLDRPDRIVMDFDPDEALPWDALVEAVGVLRKLLDTLGLAGFLKTTGGKGLHVVVPIAPALGWDTVLAFAKAMAELMVTTFPDRFTSKVTKRTRAGKILVDYLRNAEGATAVAAYSPRAKRGAPVSMPIGWDELRQDVRFDHFNVRTALARLSRRRKDPWAGFFDVRQTITPAMLRQMGVT